MQGAGAVDEIAGDGAFAHALGVGARCSGHVKGGDHSIGRAQEAVYRSAALIVAGGRSGVIDTEG